MILRMFTKEKRLRILEPSDEGHQYSYPVSIGDAMFIQ